MPVSVSLVVTTHQNTWEELMDPFAELAVVAA